MASFHLPQQGGAGDSGLGGAPFSEDPDTARKAFGQRAVAGMGLPNSGSFYHTADFSDSELSVPLPGPRSDRHRCLPYIWDN